MPTRNALASVSLSSEQITPGGPFHVTLMVWSRSYDHPDPGHRNAMIKEVYLTQLTGSTHTLSNLRITDRYGIDETELWKRGGGGPEEGFKQYTEWVPAAGCPQGVPIAWGSYTGIYDERCLADPACDAMRLQTHRLPAHQIVVFNYLIGPVTFSFDITPSPPKAVRLVMGHIGGNGGIPARRYSILPDEEFIIQFP